MSTSVSRDATSLPPPPPTLTSHAMKPTYVRTYVAIIEKKFAASAAEEKKGGCCDGGTSEEGRGVKEVITVPTTGRCAMGT